MSQAPAPSPPPAPTTAAATTCDNLNPPASAQFPAGFDYPQTSTTVQNWVQTRSGDRERLHAFCVFAGLNQTAKGINLPVWRTWGTSTQAFPWQYNPWIPHTADGQVSSGGQEDVTTTLNQVRSEASDEVGEINNPAPIYGVNQAIVNNPSYQQCLQPIPNTNPQLYSLKDGQIFQSNGDIMIAAVSYNAAALNNITNNYL